MFTLKRSWGGQTLKSASLLHLSRNINFSINQSSNGLFLVSNNKTDSTMTINELESAVYFVLDKHINNDQYFLSDIELASYVCMHLNIFDTRQWEVKVKDIYTEVKEIADGILPEESEIRNSTYLIYVLSGCTGRVSEKYVRMVKENAAHRLIKEHIVAGKGTSLIGDDVYIFCENIWEAVKSLIEKKVFIDIYPIKKCDDFYFLPKKMLCIKLHNNIENHSYSSKVFSSIDDRFPDVIGNIRNKLYISDEKYPNDAIDFSFMNPTSGGICIADDCQVEYDSYLFSSNEVRDRNVKVSSVKVFVDMLIKNIIKKSHITKQIDCLRIVIKSGMNLAYEWNTLMDVVEYIKVTAENQNIPYELKIITNGCHSEEQTEYLMQSFSQIIIYFDRLPEMQNRNLCFADNESSFDMVNRTIKQLDNISFNYSLLSIIQPEDFSKIRNTAIFIFENYPNAKTWNIKPTISFEHFNKKNNTKNLEDFAFAQLYFEAIESLDFPRNIFSEIFSYKNITTFYDELSGVHPWLLPNDEIITDQDVIKNSVVLGQVIDGAINWNKVREYLSVDTTPEIELYNLWIYGQIKEYWELVFDRLYRNNSCGIWNLKQLSFEEFPNIDVYKLNSLSEK